MNQEGVIIKKKWTTPRAAAVAGILFLMLFITSLVLIQISVPADPNVVGDWLPENSRSVSIALNLLPFTGIAFLWFIGVVQDRIGSNETPLLVNQLQPRVEA